jgi:flagellar basal-body rod modification protein FlgD
MGVTLDPAAASGAQSTQQSNPTFANSQLTSSDFLTLMIQELVNQDPLSPMDNSQLLTQVSQIKNMDTLTQLDSTMSSSTLQQKTSMAGALIGKEVSGISTKNQNVSGIVTKVSISTANGVSVTTSTGDEINVDNIQQIQEAA